MITFGDDYVGNYNCEMNTKKWLLCNGYFYLNVEIITKLGNNGYEMVTKKWLLWND